MRPCPSVPTAWGALLAAGHRCEAHWDVSFPLKHQHGAQSLLEGNGLQGSNGKNKFLLQSLTEVTPLGHPMTRTATRLRTQMWEMGESLFGNWCPEHRDLSQLPPHTQ